jgi:hypothetical protein
MLWTEKKDDLLEFAKIFDKSIILTTKDNWFCKSIAWILFLFSFGKLKREVFLENYTTTIGNMIFMPKSLTYKQALQVLIHEARHVYQFRVCGFFIHPMVGIPLMSIVYVLFLFPIFLAFGRFYLEVDADKISWRYLLKRRDNYGINTYDVVSFAKYRATMLSSADYLWAVPKKFAIKVYDKVAAEIINEYTKTKLG